MRDCSENSVDALVFDPLGLFSDVEGKEDPLQVLNAIDNPTGSKIRTEQVVIGIQISQEAYDKFFDHDTNLLYIFVHRNEGIVQRLTMPKETWKNLVSVNT